MEKFVQKINISSYQTNLYGQVSVCSLFQFMLEAAWSHAQVMDWGYDHLQTRNMFWVLSRCFFEIEKYPSWQDEITLNTWSAGTDGMYAYREFLIENGKKEVLLRGNTAWLILDLDSKKIVLLKDHKETFPKYNGNSVCRDPKRIRVKKHHDSMQFSPVLFSDLDINRHFNSVKALERALDQFGIDFLNRHEPAGIEINYIKEGLAGDQLAVVTNQLEQLKYQSVIVRESDKADLSSMEITWRKRNHTESIV